MQPLRGKSRNKALSLGGKIRATALSLGERVSSGGVFISRRRTGEGLLPSVTIRANSDGKIQMVENPRSVKSPTVCHLTFAI